MRLKTDLWNIHSTLTQCSFFLLFSFHSKAWLFYSDHCQFPFIFVQLYFQQILLILTMSNFPLRRRIFSMPFTTPKCVILYSQSSDTRGRSVWNNGDFHFARRSFPVEVTENLLSCLWWTMQFSQLLHVQTTKTSFFRDGFPCFYFTIFFSSWTIFAGCRIDGRGFNGMRVEICEI